MKKNRRKLGITLIILGLLLLAAALGLILYNSYDSNRAAESSNLALSALEQIIFASPNPENTIQPTEPNPQTDETPTIPSLPTPVPEMPRTIIDGKLYAGILEIPDLALTLPILYEYQYEDLRKNPCIYSGSVYTSDLVICAHNYDSHFGRLQTLTEGTTVIFTDVNGQTWNYAVSIVEQLVPTDIDQMVLKGDWDLSLFTCTKGGQARVTVRCKQK